jgi:hypothetical protein
MNPQNVYVFLFDGYSDWEISYATPEILNSRKYGIKTFSIDGGNVISMGGLNVHPDKTLSDIDKENIAILILGCLMVSNIPAMPGNIYRQCLTFIRVITCIRKNELFVMIIL